MKKTVLLVVFCMIMGCFLTSNCLAGDAASFYKGKTITILIPSRPGSTFDLISRVEADYIEKYTGARTLMQNSRVIQAQNKLFRSKPDGLTVILCGHGPKEISARLFEREGVKFDWTEFTLLGRIPKSSTAIVVDKQLGWTKPSDLGGKEFFHGASTPFFGPLFAEALGWDQMKVIPGMSGSERAMAMRRGELQTTAAGAAQVAQNEDLMLPLVVTARDEKGFPGVPSVKDLALKGKQKWAKWASAWDGLLYWSYTSPDVPEDRAAFLEKALEKTYNDEDFIAEMKKLNMALSGHFVTAGELRQITSTFEELTDDEIKEMQFVIQEKYQKK